MGGRLTLHVKQGPTSGLIFEECVVRDAHRLSESDDRDFARLGMTRGTFWIEVLPDIFDHAGSLFLIDLNICNAIVHF